MGNGCFHLRFDVRKVQDYIFRVPKLKYMLGANSAIGELFSTKLIDLMPESESLFKDLSDDLPEEMSSLLKKNVLSSSGGHFEAVFHSEDELNVFAAKVCNAVRENTPALEISMSKVEFSLDENWEGYAKRERSVINTQSSSQVFADAPFFQLCTYDGQSTATDLRRDDEQDQPIGSIANMMLEQAQKFYKLEATDAISDFYKDMEVKTANLATEFHLLAESGHSLKKNMLAYIKADGNGTGLRFNKLTDGIGSKNVLDAFIDIEQFWHNNRSKLKKMLKKATKGYLNGSPMPFLLMMLGGDDLFLVCVPEIALKIAMALADPADDGISVSVGVAFVKASYPVAQANEIAEMCLDSAKAAGYAHGGTEIQPYIDWHVHFDSVSQDLKDIRRSHYMLSYKEADQEITEIMSLRPYSKGDLEDMITRIEKIAYELDKEDSKISNGKIKTYRSVLKNGYKDLEFFREMLMTKDELLAKFLEYEAPQNGVRLDPSLDKIELIDFYRYSQKKEKPHGQD